MWTIYVPEGAYTLDEKTAIATRITDIYHRTMDFPRFWVSVVFHDQPAGGIFKGGVPVSDFVRIWIDHALRSGVSSEAYERWLTGVWDMLAEWVRDRDLELEVHGDETPIAFWQINGITPPRSPESEDWKRWLREDWPSALTGK
jgi:phenylpyruvate tautomerase PptA (4-oxalocrotonate tautomerase family)